MSEKEVKKAVGKFDEILVLVAAVSCSASPYVIGGMRLVSGMTGKLGHTWVDACGGSWVVCDVWVIFTTFTPPPTTDTNPVLPITYGLALHDTAAWLQPV